MAEPLPLDLFDYRLPPERIAQEPARPRHASRLLVLQRPTRMSHHRFLDLPDLLRRGDLLVVNRTRVLPCRLYARRPNGGPVELLLLRPANGGVDTATAWWAWAKPARVCRPGVALDVPGATLTVGERVDREVRVEGASALLPLLLAHGHMPLPPYIRKGVSRPEDRDDYQTLFARELGAVAAPTAGLHFTDTVMAGLAERGVAVAELVLHVGIGTFAPVPDHCATDVRQVRLHSEAYAIPQATLDALAATRAAGGRIIAVGTTSVRALESWGRSGASAGESALFICPGFEFRVIDGLLTNFHLPRSTLLMLVAALAGRDVVIAAYDAAIAEGYRFFSFGDAMLIL